MRRIKGFLVGLLGIVVFLGLLELMASSAKGLTFGVLSLLWTQFKAFFLSDIILTIVLFVLLAAGLFGTLHLSRKKGSQGMEHSQCGGFSRISRRSVYAGRKTLMTE